MSLLYNETAGAGLPLNLVREAIVRHGHTLVRVIEKEADIEGLVEEHPELVAAAGGDGTIAAAARILAGRGIPLAILPLGTANNIAKSVGIHGSVDDLVGRWDRARRHPLDLGVAEGVWGSRRFVEAVGGGLIPTGIAYMKSLSKKNAGHSKSTIPETIRMYGQLLSRLEPAPWKIAVDGVQTTGEFLLVEVLNIRSVGPNLVLSADADPSDGMFCVVMAGEEHKDELVRYIQSRAEEREDPVTLLSQHGRHITLQCGAAVHIDDQVLASSGTISIHVEAGSVEFLA